MTSCSKDVYIYYEYNGVTVTRIDRGNKIYFLYGFYDDKEKSLPESFIKAVDSGWDGCVDAYLIFQTNQKVEIRSVEGWFEKIGTDTSIYLSPYIENSLFCKWLDSIDGNFQNTINILDVIKSEINVDKKFNHSKVKVKYPEGIE